MRVPIFVFISVIILFGSCFNRIEKEESEIIVESKSNDESKTIDSLMNIIDLGFADHPVLVSVNYDESKDFEFACDDEVLRFQFHYLELNTIDYLLYKCFQCDKYEYDSLNKILESGHYGVSTYFGNGVLKVFNENFSTTVVYLTPLDDELRNSKWKGMDFIRIPSIGLNSSNEMVSSSDIRMSIKRSDKESDTVSIALINDIGVGYKKYRTSSNEKFDKDLLSKLSYYNTIDKSIHFFCSDEYLIEIGEDSKFKEEMEKISPNGSKL